MTFKTVLGLAAASAAVLAAALAPTAASAQSYGGYGGYGAGSAYAGGQAYGDSGYYDPCRRSTANRSTGGGLAGAGLGAVIGSGVAGHGAKTEGAVLGGLLGAVIGANIGKTSAACAPGAVRPYPPRAASNDYYGDRPDSGYDVSAYGRDDDRAYDERRDGGRYGAERGYRVSQGRSHAQGCSLAESPIYLPDGRVQKRFVRVCPDAQGRYQVVD